MGRAAMSYLLVLGVVTAAAATAATYAVGIDTVLLPVVAASTFMVVLSAAFVARDGTQAAAPFPATSALAANNEKIHPAG